MFDFDTILDLTGSLAVVCLLATAYGGVRRHLPGVSLAPQLLGALFGMVAVLQMHAPVSPVPGVVIDFRVVPIALAGAFLGGRGVVICIAIALVGRLAIGGVGLASGMAAIILAGGTGLAWNAVTAGPRQRGLRAMFGLGALTTTTMVAAVLLPMDVMIWFYTSAAPILVVVYLTVIPAVGVLLERERTNMLNEARLRAAAYADPNGSFPRRVELERWLTQTLAAGRFDRGAATLDIRFRPGFAQAAFWGEDTRDLVSDALYQRLRRYLPEEAEIGLLSPGHALVVGPGHLAFALDGMAAEIRREIATQPIHLPGVPAAQPNLTVTRADHDGRVDVASLLDPTTAASAHAAFKPASETEDRRLFDIAERLIAFHRTRELDNVRRQLD